MATSISYKPLTALTYTTIDPSSEVITKDLGKEELEVYAEEYAFLDFEDVDWMIVVSYRLSYAHEVSPTMEYVGGWEKRNMRYDHVHLL